MAKDEEFSGTSYTLDYGPAKDKMFYVFVAYVSAMIIGILYVIWRLRGYNKPDLSFKQILEKEARKKRMEKEVDDDTTTKKSDANSDGPLRKRAAQTRKESEEKQTKTPNSASAANGKVHCSDDDDSEEDLDSKKTEGKIGTKKLRKLQEKAERKKFAEEMELERQERKQMREERERMREIEEERQREREKQKEEEERLAKEKKEQEEHELYLELKKQFEVNEEGQDEVEGDDMISNKLEEFIQYLKDKKVVLLEDLASHFGLRTQDAIDRIQDLLTNETITGVIDDRGKFIYISQRELEDVANFVKRRGRVAISEIAAASNKLINLAP